LITQMSGYRFLNFIILADVTIGLICIPTAGKLVDVLGTPLSVTIFYFPFVGSSPDRVGDFLEFECDPGILR
jgi:hypothetical protein